MDFFMVDREMDKQTRYDFFYGIENMAVLFRGYQFNIMSDSRDGRIVMAFAHKCSSAKDFLSYLLAIHETGQINLCFGDVISIKINGSIMSYRYCMQQHRSCFNIWDNFIEHKFFEAKEKEEFVNQMHGQNLVLDVLSGKEIGIDRICLLDTVVCAIDRETYFIKGDRSNVAVTDYFLYELKDLHIENINPYQRPFCDICSALMFFKHNKDLQKSKCKNRLLLIDKKELYLLRDYNSLMTMTSRRIL